jgi:CDP-diacylglycerol--serine O-phosphatidyltransferase
VTTPTPHRHGIYLLPNLLTTAALAAGFHAITESVHGHYPAAAGAILVAFLLDGLDGRVARLTRTESTFGAHYDSLADMVSFGVAPALTALLWALGDHGRIGAALAFLFVAAVALRLARFNSQAGVADKRWFQGLPSPAGAGMVASLVWLMEAHGLEGLRAPAILVLLPVVATLMVSKLRYASFKGYDFGGRVPFLALLAIVLSLAVAFTTPALVTFLLFAAYTVSGPALTLRERARLRAGRQRG